MTSIGALIKQSQGIAMNSYVPPIIEKVRIVSVNIDDWTVDCVSEYANKRHFDVQVMAPYFHYINGEGIYVMPEVGALAWICTPSAGRFDTPFILGFQAPFDTAQANFRAGRQSLNPGDIMLRTRDENFLVLRRGGVVQIGATPVCQTMYIPLRNIIHQYCENYQLDTFGGTMLWKTERDDQTDQGDALTTLSFNVKDKANDKDHIAKLSIGSHGDGEPNTLVLSIHESGDEGAAAMMMLQITREGDVVWDLEKDWTVNVVGKYTIAAEGDIGLESQGNLVVSGKADASLKAVDGDLALSAGANAGLSAGAAVTVEAPQIKLGGSAVEPVIKGQQFVFFMTDLLTKIAAFASPPGTTGGPIIAAPAVAAMSGQLSNLLSTKNFVE